MQTFPQPRDEEKLRKNIAAGSQEHADYTNLAYLRSAEGRHEEAISLYQQALNLPLTQLDRADVSNELGWLFYNIGQRAQAQVLAQNTISLLSDQLATAKIFLYRGESNALLAYCLFRMDASVGAETSRLALTWLQRAIVEAPDSEEVAPAYSLSAYMYILLEDAREAIKLCEKCLQLRLGEVDRFDSLMALGDALLREKQFAEAEKSIEEALRFINAGKSVLNRCYFLRGIVQRSMGHLVEAIGTFQQVLAVVKADSALQNNSDILSDIYFNMGVTYHDLRDYSKGAAALEEVLAYHIDEPHHSNALLWLSKCYKGMGVPAKAGDCFEQVLASPHTSDVDKAYAREALAHLDYETGSYEKARAAFQQLLAHRRDVAANLVEFFN